jgi:outer membrane protein TolC
MSLASFPCSAAFGRACDRGGALLALIVMLAAAPVSAQPGQTPPTAGSAAAGSADSSGGVDWLVGVTEVNNREKPPEGTMTVTLDKALEIAQRVQPNIKLAQSEVTAAEAKVDEARVVVQPSVTLSAGLFIGSTHGEIIGGTGTGSGTGTGVSASVQSNAQFFSFGLGGSTGLSATASMRLYDFGLTKANIDAAQYGVDAAVAGVGSAVLTVRENVEIAYLASVADYRLVLVADATVKSEEGHTDQARRFVAAQAQDPIQLVQAQARLANARSALAQAKSTYLASLATLRAAIGWVELENDLAVDPNWPVSPSDIPPTLRELVVEARKWRPEVEIAVKTIQSADASLAAAHYERRPILSASASASWDPVDSSNGEFASPVLQPGWVAGVILSWSAWDGGKSAADVRVAKANLEQAYASKDALLVNITSQLDSARSQILAQKANVSASTEAVTAARAELQLAEAQYVNGIGSQIALADAQTAVTTAEGSLVTAEWQLATAWAQLRWALGRI